MLCKNQIIASLFLKTFMDHIFLIFYAFSLKLLVVYNFT